MGERFSFTHSKLNGLYLIDRNVIGDHRGSFLRFFCAEEFEKIGLTNSIVQMNQSRTSLKGAVRGMHYQLAPYTETKVVSCLKGSIYDVAIDLRLDSDTFLQWHGEVLSEDDNKSLYIPDGFAHGFQALTNDCEMLYLHSNYYKPAAERGLNPVDPLLSIEWPLAITDMSNRDKHHDMIDANFQGIVLK